jgi:hypothetical protein
MDSQQKKLATATINAIQIWIGFAIIGNKLGIDLDPGGKKF